MGIDKIIIYGAGIMGKALKLCLNAKPFEKEVYVFIVRDRRSNPAHIDGTTVIDINSADLYKKNTIIVALNENNMSGAVRELKERGFGHLIMLHAAGDDWASIKENYFLNNQNKCYIPFKRLKGGICIHSKKDNTTIYVVKSIYDKYLENELPLRRYEREIQVGASLTDKRICELTDDCEENISEKNRQYCELTALFWIWKHETDKYIGISHYRRRFDIASDVLEHLHDSGADIIVTVPVINTEGIGYQYGMIHSNQDWDILREEIHRLSPQYDESFRIMERQIYFHAYNMFIMRREILDIFCNWLFPILFACDKKIGIKEDPYQNRYPGFMAERLLNVFLYKHRDEYNIFVAKKKYLT